MWRALWLEKSGRSEAYFIGASPMPRLRQGDLVTIRKDTRIFGTFPDSLLHGRLENGRGYRIAKKTYLVKLRNICPGSMQQYWLHRTNRIGAYVSNPTIRIVRDRTEQHNSELQTLQLPSYDRSLLNKKIHHTKQHH